MKRFDNQWALVTGASSGFGVEFARILAAGGANLVLAARRREPMECLAAALGAKYGVEVEVEAIDLAGADAPNQLYQRLYARGRRIDVLVNNAGFGVFGEFDQTPYERIDEMLRLNIMTLTRLTHLFGGEMVKRRRGHVLLVASIGGYQATPTYAAYAASKAYVLLFGEALNDEWKKHGVKVATLCPGITQTSFLEVSGQKPTLYQRMMMMQSRPVAEIGIRAMLRGTPSVVPGLANKLTVFLGRLTPRPVQARLAYQLMKN
ncbi:SDR family oxidoreductase [Chitinivorax sp. PXF-14]|uniref:SDR family NAD(P)-dependent oxidoreductase n=1 Tax=Chitinivorax sp. PXF-14 TaxID=3230488 RepID=UPI0034665F39